MSYLLDTNVFIEAKNRYYGMDFCPAFWDWLTAQNAIGAVFSIEKVGDELASGDDDLSHWAAERGDGFFVPPDEQLLAALSTVSEWVNKQQYIGAAVNAFLQDTDYYLVAHALAHRHTVVTQEIPSDGVKRVKIPNVCIGVKVKCMTPFEMLRKERARFILHTAGS
ncbi:MAG: DUF4411 family protein [Phycisphaerales bacterium]|nr:DUF4411 family protein [Phycisphaerales bacterium]